MPDEHRLLCVFNLECRYRDLSEDDMVSERAALILRKPALLLGSVKSSPLSDRYLV